MNFLPHHPQIPKDEKLISFLDALNDKNGSVRSRYLWQQAIKTPSFIKLWYVPMIPSMDMPINMAIAKFESDKAHYLETGELPDEY